MSLDLSFLSSDPLLYFLAHSALFTVVVAGVFFTFGLLFGWCTWARYKRRLRERAAEVESMKNEIAQLKRKLAEQTSRATALADAASGADAAPPRNEHAQPDPVIDSFLSTAAAFLPQSAPGTGTSAPDAVLDNAATAPLEPAVITGGALDPAESAPGRPARKPSPTGRVTPHKNVLQALATPDESFDLTDKPGADQSFPPPGATPAVQEAADDQGETAALTSATSDPAESVPAADEAPAAPEMPAPAGDGCRLNSDPHLGLVYGERPPVADDLSHLKGVASIIERRLQEFGVYTFKQIALWNDENIHEFSRLLSFKDRIRREQWVDQARELHFQKYGERL